MDLIEVPSPSSSVDRFRTIIDPGAYSELAGAMARATELLKGKVFWQVNSTARGGGVAEMLQSHVPYFRGSEIDCRWAVIKGSDPFFTVTKRLHNNLHGELGDAGDLGDDERSTYQETLEANARELSSRIHAGDVVLLHDPQTAGLARPLRKTGAVVLWRCHVGLDTPNSVARRAWDFLRPFVIEADSFVFSRRGFAWEGLPDERITVIAPSIDAFSPKNQDMDATTTDAILAAGGVLTISSAGPATFTRSDGSEARVRNRATMVNGQPPPAPGGKLVLQVSRWDRLKDPLGVIEGFGRYVYGRTDVQLIVAGPAVDKVADDPEGAQVLAQARALWAQLPSDTQARVHLVTLPMEDTDENAAIVNAIQRKADVVVQKSLAEGFGLTVSEAMWKSRPVVATRIGGIQDQVVDGVTGTLIANPADLMAFGNAVVRLIEDPGRAARMGQEGRERVRQKFLDPRQLVEHVDLIERLLRRTRKA